MYVYDDVSVINMAFRLWLSVVVSVSAVFAISTIINLEEAYIIYIYYGSGMHSKHKILCPNSWVDIKI